MSKKQGKTFIDWKNIKKESVMIDKDGQETTIDVPKPEQKKTLEDFLRKRAQRMGR